MLGAWFLFSFFGDQKIAFYLNLWLSSLITSRRVLRQFCLMSRIVWATHPPATFNLLEVLLWGTLQLDTFLWSAADVVTTQVTQRLQW